MLVPEIVVLTALPDRADAHPWGSNRVALVTAPNRVVVEVGGGVVHIGTARRRGAAAGLAVEVGQSDDGQDLVVGGRHLPAKSVLELPAATTYVTPAEAQIVLWSASELVFPQLPSSEPLPPRHMLATSMFSLTAFCVTQSIPQMTHDQ
jgi:hypothetical protein